MADLWICVHKHRGYGIEILVKAEPGDPMGYRIEGVAGKEFDTVGEAVEWIDNELDS